MHSADISVTVGFLMQLDKLVQLLESPVFVHLRLQLLEPETHPALFKTLYGLLMLLPQSAAFELLRARLNSVSTLGTLLLVPKRCLLWFIAADLCTLFTSFIFIFLFRSANLLNRKQQLDLLVHWISTH
jgi:hypothetical protein